MVRRLAMASKRIGVEASVYCLAEGRLSDCLRHDGVAVRVFPSTGKYDLRPFKGMARALIEDKAQIIQAHTSRTHLFARILSRRVGIPNITTIHSPIAQDENQSLRRHPLRAWIERLGRRWTDHICPVSKEETERLIGEEKVPPEKIAWIPNGVEAIAESELKRKGRDEAILQILSKKNLPSDAFVAAMIASHRPRKGTDVLIRAFVRFAAEEKHALLLIIGDDEFARPRNYLSQLQDLSRQLGTGNRTYFAGFQDDPWALGRDADVIVQPSLFGEGLPLALLEAMNRGLPIFASYVPGNRECVENNVNGWLHPAGDADELASQLLRVSRVRNSMVQMGRKGREIFLERYELTRILNQWKSLYEKLTEPNSPPRHQVAKKTK